MESKFLLQALALTMIIAFSTIVSGEDSIITLPLENGETYHSILPISGETANPYRLAVIGDSIAWGNGLNQEHKYYNLVAEWLRTNLGEPVEIIVYAHSGAVISGASSESVKDANLNSESPSLMSQAENIPNNVDLILVSGGINDVGIENILDPKTSEDTIRSRSKDIQEPMKELLMYLVDNTKPDAKIVVTGYYPLITDDSKLGWKDRTVGVFLARGSEESVFQALTNLAASEANPTLGLAVSTWQSAREFGINLENIIENDPLFKANSYAFYSTSSDSLRAAVNDVNKAIGEDRVAFVDPLFQSNNGYHASESYLWEFKPGASIESNDEQYDVRSKLTINPIDRDNALCHPNIKGASRYADFINHTLKSKISDWFQSAIATQEPISTNDRSNCNNADAKSWFDKGETHFDQNEYDEAIQCYDEAIKICPQYAEAWTGKGDAYLVGKFGFFAENDPSKAIECYDEALRIDSSNSTAWNNKGTALHVLGKYDDAIQCYDEAIRINNQYAEAWYGKGHTLYEMGSYTEALQCVNQAIILKPEYPNLWKSKGDILKAIGSDEAQAAFDKANELESIQKPTHEAKGAIAYD